MGLTGRRTLKVLPWPGELSTSMLPPWASAMERAMLSPRPTPYGLLSVIRWHDETG